MDTSVYQHPGGAAIDWHAVYDHLKAQGQGAEPFLFINFTDPHYPKDYRDAWAAGFKAIGAYDFFSPIAGVADEATFRHVVGNIPAALDLESTNNLSWAQVAAAGRDWLAQAPEKQTLLYSNLNYLSNMPGAPWGHPIWFAGSVNPPAGSVIWQYGTGLVPGIQGLVDLDKWVGTEDQFTTFWQIAVPSPPPEEEMIKPFLFVSAGTVYQSDGLLMTYRPITAAELPVITFLMNNAGFDTNFNAHTVDPANMPAMGVPIPFPAAPPGPVSPPPHYTGTGTITLSPQ